jgi:hypothetical protein
MRCVWLAFSFVLAGCTFRVGGLDSDGGQPRGADFGQVSDLGVGSVDSASSGLDLAGADLLSPMPDLLGVFTPSHVDPSYFRPGASDLSGVTAIDTTALTINGSMPPGMAFVHDSHGWAVLSVGAWHVDQPVTVTGDAPLVVVAAKAVTIDKPILAAASHGSAGPGGAGPSAGSGKGGDGNADGLADDSGGGGAGFGTAGAKGGDDNTDGSGGNAGSLYGALVSDFGGGSGGGAGAGSGTCGGGLGGGGAGGGAIQISSAVSVTVSNGGGINVAGGGGRGGCSSAGSAGGGGGSGGEIFLEAPSVEVDGTLAANGGGGGGGGTNGGFNPGDYVDGVSGNDGATSAAVASGGKGGGSNGGDGGAGAAGTTAPQQPDKATNAGGGGGAVGRIWLRTHGAQPTLGGNHSISPPAGVDTTL